MPEETGVLFGWARIERPRRNNEHMSRYLALNLQVPIPQRAAIGTQMGGVCRTAIADIVPASPIAASALRGSMCPS
jgi:hypothetical protein